MNKAETLDKAIRAFVSELARLGCSNHACHFNPPKGMGTNGPCSCLTSVRPFAKRRLILEMWNEFKSAAQGGGQNSQTTSASTLFICPGCGTAHRPTVVYCIKCCEEGIK